MNILLYKESAEEKANVNYEDGNFTSIGISMF